MPCKTRFLLAAALASVTLAQWVVAQTNYPEVEPNDSKSAALLNGPITLTAGDSVSGTTVSVTADGLDYFLIKTAPLAAGVYRHRLILTSDTPTQVMTIRGLNQAAVAAAVWPGITGNPGSVDTTLQTGSGGAVQWYGFGKSEQIYFRVTGGAATTAPYTATLETTQIFAIQDCGVWNSGGVTISNIPPGHGNDVDFAVYDGNFNPIPGYVNDGASTLSGHTANTNLPAHLRRHFEPGVYYIASSNFDLSNNLGAACDDNRRTGAITDFADVVVGSSTLAPSHLHFAMSDSLGSAQFAEGIVVTQFNTTKSNPFEVRWARFTVGGPTLGACCLTNGSCGLTDQGRCESALLGVFNGAGSVCTACAPIPTDQWVDRAPAPYSRVGAGGAIVGDTFYLFSGSNASSFRVTDCYKYDIINNSWSAIAPIPHSGSVAPQLGGISNFDAAAIGADIYVVGGFIGPAGTVPPLSRLMRYDTQADTWTEITSDPYPTPIYGAGVAASGGKLYVIAGATLGSPLTLTAASHVYDPAAPAGTRWSPIAPLPTARFPSVAVVGGKIYAAASGDAAIDADRVDVYDIATNTWSPVPNLSAARAACAVFDLGGKPYVSAGGLSTFLATGEVLESGAWTAGSTVVHGMRSMAFDGNDQWLVRCTGFNGVYRAFTEVFRQSAPAPIGECCVSGLCSVTSQAACAGAWTSDGTCEPNPCPAPPTGECCVAGACSVTTQAACGGAWTNGGSCSPSPCAASNENCCRGTTCISVAAGSCTGTVAGSNSVVVAACTGNTVAGCCFGDYDHNGAKDITDIFTFLNAWFSASTYADITSNGDSTPDITDIFTFLNAWFGSCG